MTEITSIFLSLITFLIFSLFPINTKLYEKITSTKINYTYDLLFLNLLFNFVILFIISFTYFDYSHYFIFIIIFSVILNVFDIFKNTNLKLNLFKNLNFCLFLIVNLVLFIYLSRDPTLSWDGLENWYYKAQSFFYNYNFFDMKNIKGPDYYPHFGSFLWGFFWKNSLLQYEYSGRLINIFIFLLSIFSICDLIKNNNLKFLTIFAIIIICFDKFLFQGYQEILIFSFLIFASKNFYFYLQKNKKIFLIITFVCLNFLPWFKNEGYLLVLIFNFSLLICIKQFAKKKEILLFVIFSILTFVAKLILFSKYLEINFIHGGNFYLPDLEEILKFFKSIIFGLLIACFKYKICFFILFCFYMLYKNRRTNKNFKSILNLLRINLLLFFILLLSIYFSVINHNYGLDWWIDNSLDRIIYQMSGLFVIIIILYLNNIKTKL